MVSGSAGVVAFLCSKAASYTTGVIVLLLGEIGGICPRVTGVPVHAHPLCFDHHSPGAHVGQVMQIDGAAMISSFKY